MTDNDKPEFVSLLSASLEAYSKPLPSMPTIFLWFNVLKPYPIELVRNAFNHHVAEGEFPPVPASIKARCDSITGGDGRPGPDEAWGIALLASDESETVVSNEEIAASLEAARPLLEVRDRIAARRTFIDVYERITGRNRAAGVPVRWFASNGTDPVRRQVALEKAVSDYRLPQSVLLVSTRAPDAGFLPLLSAPVETQAGKSALALLRKFLTSKSTSDNTIAVI